MKKRFKKIKSCIKYCLVKAYTYLHDIIFFKTIQIDNPDKIYVFNKYTKIKIDKKYKSNENFKIKNIQLKNEYSIQLNSNGFFTFNDNIQGTRGNKLTFEFNNEYEFTNHNIEEFNGAKFYIEKKSYFKNVTLIFFIASLLFFISSNYQSRILLQFIADNKFQDTVKSFIDDGIFNIVGLFLSFFALLFGSVFTGTKLFDLQIVKSMSYKVTYYVFLLLCFIVPIMVYFCSFGSIKTIFLLVISLSFISIFALSFFCEVNYFAREFVFDFIYGPLLTLITITISIYLLNFYIVSPFFKKVDDFSAANSYFDLINYLKSQSYKNLTYSMRNVELKSYEIDIYPIKIKNRLPHFEILGLEDGEIYFSQINDSTTFLNLGIRSKNTSDQNLERIENNQDSLVTLNNEIKIDLGLLLK